MARSACRWPTFHGSRGLRRGTRNPCLGGKSSEGGVLRLKPSAMIQNRDEPAERPPYLRLPEPLAHLNV
jgi:hypothetical protein